MINPSDYILARALPQLVRRDASYIHRHLAKLPQAKLGDGTAIYDAEGCKTYFAAIPGRGKYARKPKV